MFPTGLVWQGPGEGVAGWRNIAKRIVLLFKELKKKTKIQKPKQ